ncbi:Cytochrome P450 [Jatrophihabitans endophyticus]|uniref:Cytochrome P450 n=1 Tax=Jatrophihabitans endophyticus TaxID=1206085 RepID=A0A1M5PR93_9ACTN|nr:cytochrome P450 [Jatrophihabitans endophyticus]SHH04387.1 Cytochrome P450 [Jatrophihabitans endophyticus]
MTDISDPDTAPVDLERLRREHERQYEVYHRVSIQEHLDDMADRREKCPISFSPDGGFWVLSRYDDMSTVLRKNNRGVVSFPNIPDGKPAFGQKKTIPIELDGSVHSQYRKILDPLFSPARVKELEPRIREVARDLIAGFAARGECDFVEEFAMPFPGSIFLALMGWPIEDTARMNAWVNTMLHGVEGGTEEETLAARGQAAGEIRAYMNEIIAARRAEPQDDITTILLRAEIDGAPIPDDDLYDLFVLIMLAGLDTVQSVLAQSMSYFARHQDTWDSMFADPARMGDAVEELVRWCSPAGPSRTITSDTLAVGELTLPEGERLYCPLSAGNRDPKYFPEPDEVRFDRDAKPHLSFGLGTHRCVGLHLARTELRIAFEELRELMPRFDLTAGREPHEHVGLTWGVDNVWLTFPPRS